MALVASDEKCACLTQRRKDTEKAIEIAQRPLAGPASAERAGYFSPGGDGVALRLSEAGKQRCGNAWRKPLRAVPWYSREERRLRESPGIGRRAGRKG